LFSKEHIVAEIRRTAKQNGGAPLGIRRFQAETGITRADWHAKFWTRWGDALQEAGFQPNALQGPRSEDDVLGRLAAFVRELGRVPTVAEIRLRARTDVDFPWHNTYARFGGKVALLSRLQTFCATNGLDDAASLCAEALAKLPAAQLVTGSDRAHDGDGILGHVYLLKSGRYYKIGRTNALGRRGRELAVELPESATVIHTINTDDPSGIEKYWHGRFSDRRKNGEWFELTAKDVSAFRRRKYM
jgi:hypothetical protein